MDFVALREKAENMVRRYKYVLLILLAGIFLMTFPRKGGSAAPEADSPETAVVSVQEELAKILSKIQGAGKVEVLLTENLGAETIYQTDLDRGADAIREDTVILSDSERSENGLVRQVNPPRYLGAVVVCQGGDNPGVKLAILDAVTKVTGLKSNQISVLKMK